MTIKSWFVNENYYFRLEHLKIVNKLFMNKVSFGKAKLADTLKLSVLLKTVYIETYAVEGVTSEFANFITERFSVEHLKSIISNNPDQLMIAYFNENPIGVAEIIFNSSCPIRNIIVPELSKLYVLKRFHGIKVGFGLMNQVENEVLKKGFNELYLEVYAENNRAINFYMRQEYKSIGTVDFPMESNTYKNLVMQKNLTSPNE